jgi:ATP-dependent Lon protease
MLEAPILAVQKGKGVLFFLEIELKEGRGTLFLDSKIRADQEARKAIDTAFSLVGAKKKDILIRSQNFKCQCLCGSSLGLPIYLGMHACLSGKKIKPRVFATGSIDKKGNVISVGCLAEKVKAVLGEADKLLVPKNQGLPITGMEVVEVADIQEAADIALS